MLNAYVQQWNDDDKPGFAARAKSENLKIFFEGEEAELFTRFAPYSKRSVSGIIVKNNIFNKISPDEALTILKRLSKKDKDLKKKIIEAAEDLITDTNVDEICEAVFDALDGIDVHELWDRAGPNRDGYTSPEDMSFEMFEEALEPFLRDMQRLLGLKMHQEAKLHCMAILKGIYQYEEESKSEFKDWATDVPGECFGSIISEWAKKRNVKDIKEMKNFIQKECPDWSEWAIKTNMKTEPKL